MEPLEPFACRACKAPKVAQHIDQYRDGLCAACRAKTLCCIELCSKSATCLAYCEKHYLAWADVEAWYEQRETKRVLAREREARRKRIEAIRIHREARKARMRFSDGSTLADVIALHGPLCAYCGKPATGEDHVVPVSLGGPDTIWNKLPSCGGCNSKKGARLDMIELLDPLLALRAYAVLGVI